MFELLRNLGYPLRVKKIIFALIIIQITTYFVIGGRMLERKVNNEFQEFSKRRLLNKYNIQGDEIWDEYYFSSCGDEFFREKDDLEQLIKTTNLEKYKSKLPDYIDDSNSLFIVYNRDYYSDAIDIFDKNSSREKQSNIIQFSACKTDYIPFLYSKITLAEYFSNHNDFHAMYYNEQMVHYDVIYIWLLFKWVRLIKNNKI